MTRLRDMREDADLKQSDLAQMLNICKTAVSRYELGQSDLSTELIHKLCDIFGCSADYLLCRSNLRSAGISAEEEALIGAYRAADDRARSMVALALEPWAAKKADKAIS